MLTPLVAAALYALAALLYLVFLTGPHPRLASAARWVLALAVVAHAADVALHCLHGAHPASSVREAVSFAAFGIAAIFLVATWRHHVTAVGSLVAPVALMLVIAARVTPAGPPHGIGPLGRVHISLATIGVALFAVAALASALYLAQAGQLKSKRFGLLFHRGPPLELLDRLAQRCVSIGFPIFTLSIVLGVLWMARLGRGFFAPQYLLALLTWFAFAGLLLARALAGWHGRRSALLAILGFTTSLGVLVLYLLRAALGA